jgi:hypothetical protein
MISIVFIFMGVVTALAVFAILAKTCAGKPKRAEKWEQGEIIKQLLVLSERENSPALSELPTIRELRAMGLGVPDAVCSVAAKCVDRSGPCKNFASMRHAAPEPWTTIMYSS